MGPSSPPLPAATKRADEGAVGLVVALDLVVIGARDVEVAVEPEGEADGTVERTGPLPAATKVLMKRAGRHVVAQHAVVAEARHVQVAVGAEGQALGAVERPRSPANVPMKAAVVPS